MICGPHSGAPPSSGHTDLAPLYVRSMASPRHVFSSSFSASGSGAAGAGPVGYYAVAGGTPAHLAFGGSSWSLLEIMYRDVYSSVAWYRLVEGWKIPNLYIHRTIRESCLNRARFISDSYVNYVILTRYVRRIRHIKVIHLWYRRERSAKPTWTYVERSWKAKNLRTHLAKIAHKCGRFTEDLHKNCV